MNFIACFSRTLRDLLLKYPEILDCSISLENSYTDVNLDIYVSIISNLSIEYLLRSFRLYRKNIYSKASKLPTRQSNIFGKISYSSINCYLNEVINQFYMSIRFVDSIY